MLCWICNQLLEEPVVIGMAHHSSVRIFLCTECQHVLPICRSTTSSSCAHCLRFLRPGNDNRMSFSFFSSGMVARSPACAHGCAQNRDRNFYDLLRNAHVHEAAASRRAPASEYMLDIGVRQRACHPS